MALVSLKSNQYPSLILFISENEGCIIICSIDVSIYMFPFVKLKQVDHNNQSRELDFGEGTSFQTIAHDCFEIMTTFQLWVPHFLRLLFSAVRGQSAAFTVSLCSRFCLSFHPHIGLLKVQCPQRQMCFEHFFVPSSFSLWIDRCEDHGPPRAQMENRICSLRMQRGKKVREAGMGRWREGC